jgi:hypothetical protein
MNDELNKSKNEKSLDERFAKHPHMYEQRQRIADMMEQAMANGATADEAEEMAIKQINDLGKAILTDGAQAKPERSLSELKTKLPRAVKDSKKTDLADHVRHGSDSRAVAAGDSARRTVAAILPGGQGSTAGLFPAVAASLERLWRRSIFCPSGGTGQRA